MQEVRKSTLSLPLYLATDHASRDAHCFKHGNSGVPHRNHEFTFEQPLLLVWRLQAKSYKYISSFIFPVLSAIVVLVRNSIF